MAPPIGCTKCQINLHWNDICPAAINILSPVLIHVCVLYIYIYRSQLKREECVIYEHKVATKSDLVWHRQVPVLKGHFRYNAMARKSQQVPRDGHLSNI